MAYRITFFDICLTEVDDAISDTIRYNALAHRGSKLDGKEFTEFVSEKRDETVVKQPIVVDHVAQMKKSQGN